MQDKRYLLSIAQLLEKGGAKEQEMLWRKCLKWLDTERLDKIKHLMGMEDVEDKDVPVSSVPMSRRLAENIGAGLLLQLAVLQAETEEKQTGSASQSIIRVTISDLLEMLEQSGQKPLPLEYTYGENGKPYLQNYPYYFNLSHSGEYILCAISMQEIGVDIQQTKPLRDDRIARRFFSEGEKQALAECSSKQERQELFYRLWTCKEAYGKLTGQGVAAVLDMDMRLGNDIYQCPESMCSSGALQEFILQEYKIEDYQIAVCKWKQESE